MTETPTPTPDDQVEAAPVAAGGTTDLVPGGYPVDVDAQLLPEYSRFMPLIKWLIVIPHYFALFFLGIGALADGLELRAPDALGTHLHGVLLCRQSS